LSLLLQAAGVVLAVGSAWWSRRVPQLEWFGAWPVPRLAWALAIGSSFWLLCCTAIYLAVRSNLAATRLAALRSGIGLLVFLGCVILSVLQLWYLILAAAMSPGQTTPSGLLLPCLLTSFISLWAAEILAIMGTRKMRLSRPQR